MTQATNKEYIDYPITVGIRIRLEPEQKTLIKERFDEIARSQTIPDTTGNGGIKVVTASNPAQLIQDFGCDRLTLSSLLSTTERLPVGQLQRWEKVLGITLLDKKKLDAAWKSYLKHLGF